MKVMELLTAAVEQEAADIFLIPGRPFSYKIGGRIICEGTEKIMPDEMDDMIRQIYELAGGRSEERVLNEGDDDFPLQYRGYRVSAPIFSVREVLWPALSVLCDLSFRMRMRCIFQRRLWMFQG